MMHRRYVLQRLGMFEPCIYFRIKKKDFAMVFEKQKLVKAVMSNIGVDRLLGSLEPLSLLWGRPLFQ
jgi:hypothetical protein